MKYSLLISVAVLMLVVTVWAESARAWEPRVNRRAPASWNGGYYHVAWGMPVALVVPPTAKKQVKWGWGVGNTRVTKIWYQFGRNYPGPGQYNRAAFEATPHWPSDTDQFGVYYVRGPW